MSSMWCTLLFLTCFYVVVTSIQKIEITGGEEVIPHSLPYQVAVYTNKDLLCGGTLITNKTVLTAAHCVEEKDSVVVVVGAHILPEENNSNIILTSNITIHELWDKTKIQNDIALIHLPIEIALNDNISLIELSTQPCSIFYNKLAAASGWGKTSDNGNSSNVLMKVDLEVISNIKCNLAFDNIDQEKQICTSGQEKKSICDGDSGGPLVYDDDHKKIQIGIASFRTPIGCEKNWPQVFTCVSNYYIWILDHI